MLFFVEISIVDNKTKFAVTFAATAIAQEIFFSGSFKDGTPVHISNSRDKGFAIKAGLDNEAVNSGKAAYTADELWYFVGTADGFTLHNHAAG